MQNLERKQREAEQTEAQAALATHRDELLNSPESPVGGNPQGDVTLVEFFDYNCSYCRQVAPTMMAAEADDPKLRIVYKEFPSSGQIPCSQPRQLLRPASRTSTPNSIKQ